jgi:hypothetical protein
LFKRTNGTLGLGPATTHPVTIAEVRAAQFTIVSRGYNPWKADEVIAAAEQDLLRRSS